MINKKNTVYLKFYVCTMLAFAIKDWRGSLVANFIKGPSFSPCISQGSARETEPVGHVERFIARPWLMQLRGQSRKAGNLQGRS